MCVYIYISVGFGITWEVLGSLGRFRGNSEGFGVTLVGFAVNLAGFGVTWEVSGST